MDLVSVKAVQEIVYAESNGHVTDRWRHATVWRHSDAVTS